VSRIHGRKGMVYMTVASGTGAATPIAFLSSWSFSAATDTDEVTAFGDTNKVYVSGLPDASGDFAGFYDDTSTGTYAAACDGLPRKMYLYPDVTATRYWFGCVIPDFKADGDVGSAVKVSASWKAATNILWYNT
jgi:hypothetical protein